MKKMFKKYWVIMALLLGFLVFQLLIQVAICIESNREVTQETDLGTAAMGILGFFLAILLFYLFAVICAAVAFHLSVKRLETDKSKISVVMVVFGAFTVLFAVVQAIVTVCQILA